MRLDLKGFASQYVFRSAGVPPALLTSSKVRKLGRLGKNNGPGRGISWVQSIGVTKIPRESIAEVGWIHS
jgi:hypothetical protein